MRSGRRRRPSRSSPRRKAASTIARSTTLRSGSITCGTGSPTCCGRGAEAQRRTRTENTMITRRRFNALTAAGAATATAGALAAPHTARAQSLPVVRLGNAAGIIDTQVIFLTMGQHPRLKFYEEEGCRMEILNLSGVGQSIQAIASNNCDTSAVSPIAFLGVYAKNPNLDITFPYCWLRQPHWSVAVKPDSPVKSLTELKGKNIGIRNQGDTGYFGARAMFKELGIDPDKDVDWV